MRLMQAVKKMRFLAFLPSVLLAVALTGAPEAQAAPVYRASGTFTAGGAAITPPYPAGMVANDVCLLAVESENQAISLTTANGFVEVPTWSPQFAGTAATNPGSRLALFWKRTVGGDAAPVVADSGDHTTGQIHCFSSVITSGNPWDTGAGGNDSGANDTTGTVPGASTTVSDTLVVLITSTSFNGTSAAQCSGWTNAGLTSLTEMTDNTNTQGLGGGHCLATGIRAATGAYGNTTVTLANTSFKGAISLALKPGPPGSVTGASGAAGSAQVVLTWTNPPDATGLVVLRNTVPVTDAPVDGTTYSVGNIIGTSTVACVVTTPTATCTDTGLTNGTAYHYKIFTRNTGVYYDVGVVPTGSPFTPSNNRFAVATGNWNATMTWSTSNCAGAAGGAVPVNGDNVVVCSGFTVTLNANSASLNGLTIESTGILRIGNDAVARTLTVTGGISNAGTLDVNIASNTTHALVAGGDIANTGTLNLATDAGSLCDTTFNRNGNQTVSGAGATTRFNRITLNMGVTNANILEITATNFSINPAAPTNFLTLTNGTFKFSTTGTITPFTAAPAISATRGFWLNNAGATVSSGNFDWTVTGTSDTARGLVRVSSGTLNLGAAGANDLITGNFSDIVFEGGAVTIGGALTRAAAANNVRFNMSGGTLTVGGSGAPGNYSFRMEAAASFTMSGGTIVVRREDGAGNGYQNLVATTSVTGGTIQIGDGSTPAGEVMGINSTAPMGNLLINSANATGDLQAALTVNGNVTITAGILDANTFGLSLGGNWSRTGTFTPDTGTVTFNGSAAQGITGVTTFANLTINNATGVTANSDLSITRNFTNTAGFNASTTTTTFNGTIDQTITGATAFNNLTLSNTNGSGTELTLNNDTTVNNTLSFVSGSVVTGANTLIIGNTTGCGVTGAGANQHVVGRLRKNFTGSLISCTFELGDGVDYLPVDVAFSAVSTPGTLTVFITSGDHPSIGTTGSTIDSGNNVNLYWTFAVGGGLAYTGYTPTFNYRNGTVTTNTPSGTDDNDAAASAPDYLIQRYTGGAWFNTTLNGTPTDQQASASGVTDVGEFVVGASVTPPFLYEKEFIYTRELFY